MKSLSAARAIWRVLPLSLRRSLGRRVYALAAPVLAARLRSAARGMPASSAAPSVLGVFHAALGHGTAARLLAEELSRAGLPPHTLDVTAAAGADMDDLRDRPGDDCEVRKGPLVLAINPDTALLALAGQSGLLRDRAVIGYFVWELEEAPRS